MWRVNNTRETTLYFISTHTQSTAYITLLHNLEFYGSDTYIQHIWCTSFKFCIDHIILILKSIFNHNTYALEDCFIDKELFQNTLPYMRKQAPFSAKNGLTFLFVIVISTWAIVFERKLYQMYEVLVVSYYNYFGKFIKQRVNLLDHADKL